MSSLINIFASEHKRLVSYVRNLFTDSGSVDAEDIVQDVFLATFNAESVSPIEDTMAYIYRAISNRIIDIRRKKKCDVLSSDESDENGISLGEKLFDERLTLELLYDDEQIRSTLFESLSKLSELEQKIIIENEFESKTFAELSKETGLATGTLLSKKSRAIKKLAAIMTGDPRNEIFDYY